MTEQIEKVREKLNTLVSINNILYNGEVLRVSQELDKLIYLQYQKGKRCTKK